MTVLPAERADILKQAKARKMARSVHAYVRGNTARFYDWLDASDAARLIPQGPPIWICGDCHLGNLGPLADAGTNVDVQIRDLDQTVIGNPALDLVRLGLSLETAARSADLPGVTTARMIEAMANAYLAAFDMDDDDARDAPREPDVVRVVRKRAAGRKWRQLAADRIGDTKPSLPIGRRFWPLTGNERSAIDALFDEEAVRERALALAGYRDKGRLRVIDAAYWKKGCSSLGQLRYAVLLGVAPRKGASEYLALVDIKEAVKPLAPVLDRRAMPRDNAERVVAGARALSPHLGERMIAARLLGRAVVLRELKPQDLKIEIGQFSHRDAVRAASYLAHVVGAAHARQLNKDDRTAWQALFSRRGDAALNAPSWLWRAVVDLAGNHEAAYLEHCRRYALSD
ncbi:DUF2252 family protein [Sphingomonas sp. AR_OL41]|uniref:DUF2252 family protein n=1 Tax=Sphingomonas sp. AR_OL41 TaxID=3042729 RepID=UPI002480D6A5|nr:DUF2252 family protein [Sphingomonas sp. AR_OL41]MDH7972435.1 DUF2252 family protein [Sphingomonas sp. AR_OL41]